MGRLLSTGRLLLTSSTDPPNSWFDWSVDRTGRFEFAEEYGTSCHDLTCHNRCLDPCAHVPSHPPDPLCSQLMLLYGYTRPHRLSDRHTRSHYPLSASLNIRRGERCVSHPLTPSSSSSFP